MEYFGFSSSDASSPMGLLIRSATDSLQNAVDWAKVLDICDSIISDGPEVAQQATRVILKRLQEADQNIVALTLALTEACMKNCGVSFASTIDRSFMDELIGIAKGNKGVKNADEAKKIIQQWGRAYEGRRNTYPLFFDTYVALKSRGMIFPAEEESKAVFEVTDPSQTRLVNSAPYNATNEDEFARLDRDLETVYDQIRLCREMLLVTSGIETDDALSEVIGFLEACRDRMIELIEAGTHGLLGENLFAKCLRVNDAIFRTLEAEKAGLKEPIVDDFSTSNKSGKEGKVAPTQNEQSTATGQQSEDLLMLFADPNVQANPNPLSVDQPATKQSLFIKPLPPPPHKQGLTAPAKPVTSTSIAAQPIIPVASQQAHNSDFGMPALPAPTQTVKTQQSAVVEDVTTPFASMHLTQTPAAAVLASKPAAPAHSTAPTDLLSTPNVTPAVATQPAAAPAQQANKQYSDFDAFLDSLEPKQNQ